jgi:hypothetical protein
MVFDPFGCTAKAVALAMIETWKRTAQEQGNFKRAVAPQKKELSNLFRPGYSSGNRHGFGWGVDEKSSESPGLVSVCGHLGGAGA